MTEEYNHNSNGSTIWRRITEYRPPKSWRTWLIGRPLETADAPHQTINKTIGLAVFASDALSSTAYAPQEMMGVLIAAGMVAFRAAFPLALLIVFLLIILTLSYEQTIHAYPGGGGAYIVSRDNLGDLPAQLAAAALLLDYILTVAVSISSGVAQIVSAYENLYNFRVEIAVFLVIFVMVINLRGVREAGSAFAIPTYFFVTMMYITVGVGLFRYFSGGLGVVTTPPTALLTETVQPLGWFLLLRAFSNGTTALTGVEAISNGIPAFKEPKSRNAGNTLIAMSVILASLLLGIVFLSIQIQAVPSETETVISQLVRTVMGGRSWLYLAAITSTTVILVMAANTSFAGFPRLGAITALDGFIPRQMAYRGSRLVYSRGIVTLAILASGLIILFQASVTRLIPLYAIGVFLSFTLSQAGMARRWWKIGHLQPGVEVKERGSVLSYDKAWRFKMLINGLGTTLTAVVTLVFTFTKFREGAFIVIILIPILVVIFSNIHKHYQMLAKSLSLDRFGPPPPIARHRVILPISTVHRGTIAALRYAHTLTDDITAVHVSIDHDEALRVEAKWEEWGEGYRLVILESPYRVFVEPLLSYIEEIAAARQPNEIITIVVPQFVPRHWWANALHTQTAVSLRLALLFRKNIVVTDVPYQVEA